MGGDRAAAAMKTAGLGDGAKSRCRRRWPQRIFNDLRCIFESVPESAPWISPSLLPHAILLNLRDAGQRSGGNRGNHLRVAPTDNLARRAAQPNNTGAVRVNVASVPGTNCAVQAGPFKPPNGRSSFPHAGGGAAGPLLRLLFCRLARDLRRRCGLDRVSDEHR